TYAYANDDAIGVFDLPGLWGTAKPPNLSSNKRGPKPGKREGAHNETIAYLGVLCRMAGGKIIAGGREEPEITISIPAGGQKAGRRPDLICEICGVRHHVNVGWTLADGRTKVSREQGAIDDLGLAGINADFCSCGIRRRQ